MWRDCNKKCPLQLHGKCVHGSAHKVLFGEDCTETNDLIKRYNQLNIKWE